MVFQPSFGLYIGKDSANLVLLGKSIGGPKLIASATRSLDPDAPPGRKLRSAFSLLNEFMSQYRVAGGYFYVGLESDQAAMRHLKLPMAVKENLRASLGYEMENYVPLNADNVYFDYQLLGEDKNEGTLELLLVVTRKENIQRVIEAAEDLGRRIDGVEIGATALTNAAFSLASQPDSDACALVFIGDSWAEMAFTRKGCLIYGTEIESGDDPGQLANSIERHLERIVHSVGIEDSRPDLIVFGPGVTDGLMETLKSKRLNTNRLEGLPRALNSHGLILAYGLATRPYLKTPVTINLMPLELRRKPSKASQYVMIVLCALVVISLLGWWGSEVIQQRRKARRLDKQLARLEKQVKKVEMIRKQYQDLALQIKTLQQVIQSPVSPLDILRELTERIPEDAWLSEVSILDHKVIINGYADVATELIPILENSPLFHDVAFLSPVSKTRDGKERFRIGLEIG